MSQKGEVFKVEPMFINTDFLMIGIPFFFRDFSTYIPENIQQQLDLIFKNKSVAPFVTIESRLTALIYSLFILCIVYAQYNV